jgi:hypothetical protein
MAINKVGTKGIKDGAISAIDFADNTITSDKLVNSAITNALLSNSSITLSGTSIALGASASFTNKFVDWQSVITGAGSSSTAVAGKGYFINTTSAVHTINLPASASIGDFVAIKDYAGTFNTNNLTIGRNGHNIQGVANNSLISTNRASLVLVYVDTTKGWLYWEEHNVADLQQTLFITATGGTITTSGDFKIHSFTGDGCFVVSQLGAGAGPSNVDYLVVAGGGGGGASTGSAGAGGGGAGGYRTTFPSPGCNAGAFPITAQTYPITVGAGGTVATYPQSNFTRAPNGSPSTFSTITSTGGGGGANYGTFGAPGGSGGGAVGYCGPNAGGAGNTPPVSPSQGNPGGSNGNTNRAGAGGGGATAAGTNSTDDGAGKTGGAGASNSISGSPVSYAGGGGGGGYSPNTGGAGGSGGGGTGGTSATSGTVNTGGGGGGASTPNANGAAGGSGIVIIRYKFQ